MFAKVNLTYYILLCLNTNRKKLDIMNTNLAPILDAASIQEVINLQSKQSLVFHCVKCKHNTSGIYQDQNDTMLKCPACCSPLIYCPVCKKCVSGTETFNVLTCDMCSTDYITKSTIDHLISRDRKSKEIVLSGIRATGRLHLGNFLGAVKQFVDYEKEGNLCLYFIADWHTLTTCHDPREISSNIIGVATDYLAAGLNPERSIIYAQLSIPELAELALYLAMFQSKNQLENLPTLKDLVKDKPYISMGHLYYPVLMAADILGPQATIVPVGSDQIPNVELACGLARKFNNLFGHTFVIPQVGLRTVKIPGLSGGKMGKSEQESSIQLDDDLETITDKYLRHGITDPNRKRKKDPGDPKQCLSVYPVHKILYENDSESLQRIEHECRNAERGCQDCKRELARNIDTLMQPFHERKRKLLERQGYVREILHFGGMKAREIVQPTLSSVRKKLGVASS